jgi:hypothetical protein
MMVEHQGSKVSWQNMASLLGVAGYGISRSIPQGGESRQLDQKPTPERGEDLPGYGTVLFVRAVVEHPAGHTPSLPTQHSRRGMLLPSMYSSTLGIRKAYVSGPQSHGPHVRLPTHRRWHVGHRRKAGSRLGGLTLGRAGFPPAGRHTTLHGGLTSSNPN